MRQPNSHYSNRISLSALVAIGTLFQAKVASLQAVPPYPVSEWKIQWDLSSHRQEANGADNWPITWSNDNHQYTIWGDNRGGFQRTSTKLSFGVSRISGGKSDYTGKDIFNGDPLHTWRRRLWDQKSYGILSVGGTLYAFVGPGSGDESCIETRLAYSTDKGRSWSRTDVMWTSEERLCVPTLLNLGKDYAGARDNFVYVYSGDSRGKLTGGKGILLGRVLKNKMATKSAYEWFDGVSGGNPTWTKDISSAEYVFHDNNGVQRPAVSYNAGLKRYLLTTAHGLILGDNSSMLGKWGLFEAPEPWGPWKTIAYYDNDFGLGNRETFFYNFANKWASPDGKNVVLVFTGITQGNASFDSWNTVEGQFSKRIR
jgi:hypothetical protein